MVDKVDRDSRVSGYSKKCLCLSNVKCSNIRESRQFFDCSTCYHFLLVDTFVTPLVCLFLVPKIKMELKRLLNKKVLENLSREQILLMKYLKNKI